MRILAHEQWPGDVIRAAIVADGLCGSQDVRFGEAAVEWCAPMSAGAERDQPSRSAEIRLVLVIGALERGGVDQHVRWSRLTGEWVYGHVRYLLIDQFFLPQPSRSTRSALPPRILQTVRSL